MAPAKPGTRVTVVGGGIAGITAALRLAQRGYRVTLYEQQSFLGGNLSAHQGSSGLYHDVYSHMYANWYHNFWRLIGDLGVRREKLFEPRDGFHLMKQGARHPHYVRIHNVGAPSAAWSNLTSGVAPPADMVLWSYSLVDLLTQPFERGTLLGQHSVSGFLGSRFYATERSARLHDYFLMVIWSVHGYMTAAASYQRFIKYGFPDPTPYLWVLRGNLQQKLIGPLTELLRKLKVVIRTGVALRAVRVEGGRARAIELQDAHGDENSHTVHYTGRRREEAVDQLILAVPARPMARIATSGTRGRRIVDVLPQLAEARRLKAEPIVVMDLYFKRKLPGIPKEHVVLPPECPFDLTFLDLSQLWRDEPALKDVTALTVAASDFYALTSDDPQQDAHAMIQALHDFVPVFRPGRHWGDEDSDIDWDKCHVHNNVGEELFINEVGSWDWRPEPTYDAIDNLYFAGDYVRNDVDIATVESAVTSGLNAAAALWRRAPRGKPIEIERHEGYPLSAVLGLKLAMAPAAYAAKWWSTLADAGADLAAGTQPRNGVQRSLDLALAPAACAADMWSTGYALWEELVRGSLTHAEDS